MEQILLGELDELGREPWYVVQLSYVMSRIGDRRLTDDVAFRFWSIQAMLLRGELRCSS